MADRALRVLHYITGLGMGGAETMLVKLLAELRPTTIISEVVSLTHNLVVAPKIEAMGVAVHCLSLAKYYPSLLGLWKSKTIASRFNPDLIQGWMYHGNVLASVSSLGIGRRPPVVWNIRASIASPTVVPMRTRTLIRTGAVLSGHPKSIVYNSETSSQQHAALGYEARRGVVIPNGFDSELFKPSIDARSAVRRELGIADDAILVGLIARHHRLKDHPNFFSAAGKVARLHPGAQFVLAGLGLSWGNPAISQLVHENGLGNCVHLLGVEANIPRLTAALDIACSSSMAEAFSNTIGEAMACGVPCVVTDVGDSRRIVGESGLVVPPRDASAFAEAIDRLLCLEVGKRMRLGEAARRRVEQEYAIASIARRYVDLYTKVASAS